MAEAMEFDFSLPSNEGKKFDPDLVEKVIIIGTAPLEEKTADAFSENLNRKFPKSVKVKLEKLDRKLELAKTDQDKCNVGKQQKNDKTYP